MPFNYITKKVASLFKRKENQSSDGIFILPKIAIRYSYEWKEDVPLDERDTEKFPSRPFCKKMVTLNRYYSREDIQKIGSFLGYDVFNRCGGDDCRHIWVSNAVIKKDN